jgi:hypothetical protein
MNDKYTRSSSAHNIDLLSVFLADSFQSFPFRKRKQEHRYCVYIAPPSLLEDD